MRACVHIYSMMYMHEEAVALALQVIPLIFLGCVLLLNYWEWPIRLYAAMTPTLNLCSHTRVRCLTLSHEYTTYGTLSQV